MLGADGRVLDAVGGAREPALTEPERERARDGGDPARAARARHRGHRARARRPARGGGAAEVVVVGQSLDDRDETLAGLAASFAIGGPIAVALASLLGYALAAAGLAPVEAMRRRAAEVSLERDGERLPLPAAHDEIRRLGETLNAMLDRLRDVLRARAPLRGRRQPRAAHAAGRDQDRAGGGAARRRPRARGARGADGRGGGVRPARAARPRTCWCWRAAARAGCRSLRASSTSASCSSGCASASPTAPGRAGARSGVEAARRPAPRRRRAAPRPGAREPGGQRAAPRRGRRRAARAVRRRGDGARGGRRRPRLPAGARRARLRALRPRRRGAYAATGPGSASRSSAPSPRPMAGPRASWPARPAPRCGSRCRQAPACARDGPSGPSQRRGRSVRRSSQANAEEAPG